MIAAFLSGPGDNALPQVIFSYARRGINPTIYAAATLLIVTVKLVAVGCSLWGARQARRREREMAAALSGGAAAQLPPRQRSRDAKAAVTAPVQPRAARRTSA